LGILRPHYNFITLLIIVINNSKIKKGKVKRTGESLGGSQDLVLGVWERGGTIKKILKTGSSAHPEPLFVAQVNGDDGGGPSRLVKVVNPGEGFIASSGWGAWESMAR
jgi:hypothetical protein